MFGNHQKELQHMVSVPSPLLYCAVLMLPLLSRFLHLMLTGRHFFTALSCVKYQLAPVVLHGRQKSPYLFNVDFIASSYLHFSSKWRRMPSPLVLIVLWPFDWGRLIEVWTDFEKVSWSSNPHTRSIQEQDVDVVL